MLKKRDPTGSRINPSRDAVSRHKSRLENRDRTGPRKELIGSYPRLINRNPDTQQVVAAARTEDVCL